MDLGNAKVFGRPADIPLPVLNGLTKPREVVGKVRLRDYLHGTSPTPRSGGVYRFERRARMRSAPRRRPFIIDPMISAGVSMISPFASR